MAPSSNRADDGSGTWEDSSPSNLYHGTTPDSSEDEDRSNLAEERLRMFLFGPGSTPYFGWTSEQDAVREYTCRMQPYLDDFDEFMGNRRSSLPYLPPVQVFPVRRHLPGEQPPYRLVDGVLATQPPRGRRRGTTSANASARQMTASTSASSLSAQTNSDPTPTEARQGSLNVSPPPQHRCPNAASPTPSNFDSTYGSTASNKPLKSNGKAALHINPSNSNKESLSSLSWDTQKQHQFAASCTNELVVNTSERSLLSMVRSTTASSTNSTWSAS
jgi:hypothetical protein